MSSYFESRRSSFQSSLRYELFYQAAEWQFLSTLYWELSRQFWCTSSGTLCYFLVQRQKLRNVAQGHITELDVMHPSSRFLGLYKIQAPE